MPLALGALRRKQVPARGVLAQNLARAGDLEAFRDRFSGLAARDRFGHKTRKIVRSSGQTTIFRRLRQKIAEPSPSAKFPTVNAAELIKQIEALPPAELEIIRNFIVNGATPAGEARDVKYASDEQFNEAATRVFEKHDELLRKLAQ